MYKESALAIEGGFHHPDAPNRITLTETKRTTYTTPEELTKYLNRLRLVRDTLDNGGFTIFMAGIAELLAGLVLNPEIGKVGIASMAIGFTSAFRSLYVSSKYREITEQLHVTPVSYVEIKTGAG